MPEVDSPDGPDVNEQAAKLCRWLLAGNGALKNVAQLLTDSFGSTAVAAATVDAATIVAYPVDPAHRPAGDAWTPTPLGWAHPLHSQLLPLSLTADHHVLAGITSRNELLILNLTAVRHLGINSPNPIPMMRSWVMQILTKTPAALVTVTDAALNIAGAPRLSLVQPPEQGPSTTIMFTTGPADRAAPSPMTVSVSRALRGPDVVLCDGALSGVHVGNRYWPLWRRMELPDPQWAVLCQALDTARPPVGSETAPSLDVVAAAQSARAEFSPQRSGVYALGEPCVVRVDIAGNVVTHAAVATDGVDAAVGALMVVAATGGVTPAQWRDILTSSALDGRALRNELRQMVGGGDPIVTDHRGLLVTDLYCDWHQFIALAGNDPTVTSIENLSAATALIRGTPFAGMPDAALARPGLRELRTELVDLCTAVTVELATRHMVAGDSAAAYRTALVGLDVCPHREDLWAIAAATVSDADADAFLTDLRQAVPAPTEPALRQLTATDGPESD